MTLSLKLQCARVSTTKLPLFSAAISNSTVGQCYTMWMLFLAWKRHTVCTNGIHIVIFSIFSFIVVAVVLPWQKRTQLLALNILNFAIFTLISHTHFTPASPMSCLCISYIQSLIIVTVWCGEGYSSPFWFDTWGEESSSPCRSQLYRSSQSNRRTGR